MQFIDTSKNSMIKLYHGSPCQNITKFNIDYSRNELDFGKGIYFTTDEEQAKQWSLKGNVGSGAVYEISINPSLMNIKRYTTYSDEFIETFCLCRVGLEDTIPDLCKYDAIYGYMLDHDSSRIIKYTNDYVMGIADAATVRANLRLFDHRNQFCIKKQELLDSLKIHRIMFTKRIPNSREIKYTKIVKGE
ncbi:MULTISPECIES: DUF3990 domain-containing protein [unclassified Butyrivibrio]|uniref:DUF3990 domain-containing protein n=1 Tax=unclassified Butyrivibrio TaxID=2639466 RepID=UPI00041205F5|nr:DUF3990 domain-containing protein [Butyrivibrio sp. MB2005]